MNQLNDATMKCNSQYDWQEAEDVMTVPRARI